MKLLIFILFISCQEIGTAENDIFRDLPSLTSIETVTYEQVNELVIQPFGCAGCHGDWAGTELGILSRVVAGDPSSSALFLRTQDGTMPLGGSGIGQARVDLIERYILDLAP